MADIKRIIEGVAPQKWVDDLDIARVAQRIAAVPLQQVVGNIVLDALEHLQDLESAPGWVVSVDGD